MKTASHFMACSVALLALSACQATGSGLEMEPRTQALASGMHPTIRSAFERDYINVIVKGTSAAAMARACPSNVRVVPLYRASLDATLRANDIEFSAGTSRREIAKKVAEHRQERDCSLLAARLNRGGYDNLFLEPI